MKTIPVDLKKISDVVDEVVKNTKFNSLNTKLISCSTYFVQKKYKKWFYPRKLIQANLRKKIGIIAFRHIRNR